MNRVYRHYLKVQFAIQKLNISAIWLVPANKNFTITAALVAKKSQKCNFNKFLLFYSNRNSLKI